MNRPIYCKIFLKLRYSGNLADCLIKNPFKKLQKCFKKEHIFQVYLLHCNSTKMSYFTKAKEKIASLS